MYLESFIQHLEDQYGFNGCDKGSLVKIRLYGCGCTQEEDMKYSRIEVDESGNLVIIADDN
jgi:hypothetical protein